MKSLVQRILFYLRYEMTDDVRMRVELTCIACVMLACLGVLGYRLHALHRMEQETSARIATLSAEIRSLAAQAGKRQHPTPRQHFEFHKPGEAPKSTSNVKTKD